MRPTCCLAEASPTKPRRRPPSTGAPALVDAQLGRLREALGDLPIFVFTFLEPSFPYMGRLLPSGAVDNAAGFVRQLNERLADLAAVRLGVHLFDLNQAFDTVGRLHLHDDVLASSTQAAVIGTGDDPLDKERFEPMASNHRVFDTIGAQPILRSYIFRELSDALKTLRGTDRLKLIVVDLDDTLWRGVAADSEVEGWRRTEGWPLGFAEALLVFKRRGGLLAVCSKNDEALTREHFASIWGARLRLEDFAALRIGWSSKAEAVGEILRETGLLADHTLFIDDNPRERAEVAAALPAIRTLGGSPRDWRRVILRSPETQVDVLTEEARRRTDLVRARSAREAEPAAILDRQAWLVSLALKAHIATVEAGDGAFARAFELLNKTNQFNTTGRRWTRPELERFLRGSGLALALTLKDRFLDNGLVGLALVAPGEIVQVVVSCRVFGLGAETALAAVAVAEALRGSPSVRAETAQTSRNLACRGFFESLGFVQEEVDLLTRAVPAIPTWIELALEGRLMRPVLTAERST